MGSVTFGIPGELARRLLSHGNIRTAVETGTHSGGSARELAALTDAVHTIELSPSLYEEAKRRSGHYTNIKFYLGDSVQLLPEILAELTAPALFWLDGHWCEGDSAGRIDPFPLIREIQSIDQFTGAADSYILVDDARLFLGGPTPPYCPGSIPTFVQVFDALRATYDRFVTVLDDVVIAGPQSTREVTEGYWLWREQERVHAELREAQRALSASYSPPRGRAIKIAAAALAPHQVQQLYRRLKARSSQQDE